MGRREELYQKLQNNPKNVRFEDLDKLLRLYGFESRQPKGGSSHYFYKREGCPSLTIPRHKPMKTVYVKMVLERILECGAPEDKE